MVAEALRSAAIRLSRAGIETAEQDAEALLRHAQSWDRTTLFTRLRDPLTAETQGELDALIEARASRRPLQHLLGTQAFWRHEFVVTPDVLIPRPETEILVEAAVDALRGLSAPVAVDVGTGSGCIALSLAHARPDAEVHATDISPRALAVAGQNAQRLGLTHAVRFHEADLLAPWTGAGPTFHLVASNPPYVSAAEVSHLEPEVRDHEPRMALVPPGHALSIYERLIPAAAAVLREEGRLILEVGAGQAEAVVEIVRSAGLVLVRVAPDLRGIPRTIVAHRP